MTTLKDFRTIERSRVEYALLGIVVCYLSLGQQSFWGRQGWSPLGGAANLHCRVSGTLRQRASGMIAFAVFGFVQILLVAIIGTDSPQILVLLFAVSFVSSWMMGYGGRQRWWDLFLTFGSP